MTEKHIPWVWRTREQYAQSLERWQNRAQWAETRIGGALVMIHPKIGGGWWGIECGLHYRVLSTDARHVMFVDTHWVRRTTRGFGSFQTAAKRAFELNEETWKAESRRAKVFAKKAIAKKREQR